MSNIDSTFASLVATIDSIDAQEGILTATPQTATDTLSALIEESATAAGAASSIKGQIAGYEVAFIAAVAAFAAAREAGNSESTCRKALAADQKQSGAKHFGATEAGGSAMDLLGSFYRVDGDLPQGWVYRPASNSTAAGIPLDEDEQSLVALIRKVQNPGEVVSALKAAGHGKMYGKATVQGILAEATDKAGAIAALEAQVRLIARTAAGIKAEEKGPKDALRYLKAASGPLGKVSEALDAALVGDAAECRNLIAALEATLAAAKAHTALAV